MEYGLIGHPLGHSYSKLIHESLMENYHYELMDLEENQLASFMKNKNFKAINVTIPYKKAVIPYLDCMEESAKNIGAVNTIVCKNNKLYGYNTDYYGFFYTLKKHRIVVENKKILILGDGGASQAVQAVIRDLNAKSIFVANRTPKPNTIDFQTAKTEHMDAEIIINTTPCGMYPHVKESCIDLSAFHKAEAFLDCIYNPIETTLCLQAKKLQVPIVVSGLEMLVAQAVKALEHFKNVSFDSSSIDDIYRQILMKTTNIIVHGTNTDEYKKLASMLDKTFIKTEDTSYAFQKNLVVQTHSIHRQEWIQNGWILMDQDAENMKRAYLRCINQF